MILVYVVITNRPRRGLMNIMRIFFLLLLTKVKQKFLIFLEICVCNLIVGGEVVVLFFFFSKDRSYRECSNGIPTYTSFCLFLSSLKNITRSSIAKI